MIYYINENNNDNEIMTISNMYNDILEMVIIENYNDSIMYGKYIIEADENGGRLSNIKDKFIKIIKSFGDFIMGIITKIKNAVMGLARSAKNKILEKNIEKAKQKENSSDVEESKIFSRKYIQSLNEKTKIDTSIPFYDFKSAVIGLKDSKDALKLLDSDMFINALKNEPIPDDVVNYKLPPFDDIMNEFKKDIKISSISDIEKAKNKNKEQIDDIVNKTNKIEKKIMNKLNEAMNYIRTSSLSEEDFSKAMSNYTKIKSIFAKQIPASISYFTTAYFKNIDALNSVLSSIM